jgi:glycosyltransferase involved in cell wall biosynthesis
VSPEGAPPLAGLSIVVPAYNEAGNVGGVVRAVLAVAPEVAGRSEVIVVDDGSRDGTAAEVAGIAGVRVVRHPTNRGYGAALRTGLASGREPWSFVIDGDGQFDPQDLPRLAAIAAEADVVAGYRAQRADPLGRRLCGRVWSVLVRRLLGVRVRDVNCAFKLVRREVVAAVALESTGALVSAELLGKAAQQGFRIRQVAVSHRPRRRGRATGASARVVWRALRELLALGSAIRAPGRAGGAGAGAGARVAHAHPGAPER